MGINQPLLTVAQVAERINVTRATIYKILKSDPTFPRPIMVARRAPRYRPEELDGWLESRRVRR